MCVCVSKTVNSQQSSGRCRGFRVLSRWRQASPLAVALTPGAPVQLNGSESIWPQCESDYREMNGSLCCLKMDWGALIYFVAPSPHFSPLKPSGKFFFFRMIRHPLFQTRGFHSPRSSLTCAHITRTCVHVFMCSVWMCEYAAVTHTHTHTHTQETWAGPDELTDPDSKCQSSLKLNISYQYFS